MSQNRIKAFLNSGSFVGVTMFAGLAAMHWAWNRIQENPLLVQEREKRPHPFWIWLERWQQKPNQGEKDN